MNGADPFPIQKVFLYTLISAVAVGAFLAIAAILAGNFGVVEMKVLGTTAVIAAAGVCGMACGAYQAASRRKILPWSGITLTLLAAVLIVAGMWVQVNSEIFWQVTAAAAVLSVACSHLALLSMARLAAWFQWSLLVAYVVIFGVAAIIVVLIFTSLRGSGTAGMFQLLAVAAIIDAAFTVLIPIFHWLSRGQFPATAAQATVHAATGEIDVEIARLRARIAELERQKQQMF